MKDFQGRNKEIRESRLSFLNDRNKAYREYIDMKDTTAKRQQKVLQGKEEQRKIKKRAASLLEKVEERKQWRKSKARQEPPQTPLEQQTHININKFAQKFLQIIADKKQSKKAQNAQEFLRRLLPYNSPKSSTEVKESQHFYHPPSKMLIKPDPNNTNTKDYLGLGTDSMNPSLAKRKNEPTEKYKLNIHSEPVLRVSSNFKGYYSGGPADDDDRVFQVGFIGQTEIINDL